MQALSKGRMFGFILTSLLVLTVVAVACMCFCYGKVTVYSWKHAVRHYQHPSTRKSQQIVASCTSMPGNMRQLQRTLISLLMMNPAPAQIFVNLPTVCARTGESYCIPRWLSDAERPPFVVLLPAVVDTGPSTKYLPTLHHLHSQGRSDQAVLIFDDDAILDRHLVAYLEHATQQHPNAALTFGGKRFVERQCLPTMVVATNHVGMGGDGSATTTMLQAADFSSADDVVNVYAKRTWRSNFQRHGMQQRRQFVGDADDDNYSNGTAEHVDIIMGHSTYVVRPRFFDLQRLSDYSRLPKEARFVDDIVISGCLAERGIARLVTADYPEPRKDALVVCTDLYDEFGRRGGGGTALHNSVNRTAHNDNVMIAHFRHAWW